MAGKDNAGSGKNAALQTLRMRAEEILAAADKPFKDGTASEMSKLLHELHIHQVELEMQNEALRKSQAETEKSRKAYQDLWEHSPAGSLVVDFAGRITAVNRAGQRLFGKPENSLLNERFAALVAPENQVPVHLLFERAVVTGLAERQEVRILKPVDTPCICLLEVRSLGGAPGREQIQAVLTDITRQKQAQEIVRSTKERLEIEVEKRTAALTAANRQLRQEIRVRGQAEADLSESQQRFKSIFDNTPIGFYRTTPDGRLLDANPALIQILGYASFEALAAANLNGPDFHPEYLRHEFKQRIERDGEILGLESRWKRPDGGLRHLRENGRAIRDDAGNISHYEGTIEDVTDQRQAEEQIRNLSQQLIKAQEAERQMISRELHDRIAQDLSTLLISLNKLFDRQPDVKPEVRKKIVKFSEILQETIKAVRDLSYDLRLPGLDDIGLVAALATYCEEFAEKTGLEVDFQATGMSTFKMDFDTEMNVYRLIQEGLNNINRHAEASRATIRLIGTYPNVILRIEDDGKGFDVEERSRKADSEKRMGLRSMAERVRLIRGEMAIQSQPLQGTQIFIKFPYQENTHDSEKNHNDRG